MEYFKEATLKIPLVSSWTKEYIWSLKRSESIHHVQNRDTMETTTLTQLVC